MTRNIPVINQKQLQRILEEKHRLKIQKEILTALCLSLVFLLSAVLILI